MKKVTNICLFLRFFFSFPPHNKEEVGNN